MRLKSILTSSAMAHFDIEQFITSRAKQANISSKSYLVTVLGDVLAVHGDWIWLGSLIEALQGLGYSERLVRTSVFRLVQDQWLDTKKIGRRSYYCLTESAKGHNQKAARRIYAADFPPWDGRWLLVFPTYVAEPKLSEFRRQLDWLGFSVLAGGVYAHPSFEQQSLEETIAELDLAESVVIFSSETLDDASAKVLKKLVHDKWGIEQLEQEYQQFLVDYTPVLNEVMSDKVLSQSQCFLLRTLLIHEYRRILLKDHELPQDMLPASWAGYKAHQLVASLYQHLSKPSISYITQHLANAEGALPTEDDAFWQRFK